MLNIPNLSQREVLTILMGHPVFLARKTTQQFKQAAKTVGRHLAPLRSALGEEWPDLLGAVGRVEKRVAELSALKTTWDDIWRNCTESIITQP